MCGSVGNSFSFINNLVFLDKRINCYGGTLCLSTGRFIIGDAKVEVNHDNIGYGKKVV